jgi:RNA polymerase sigma-B factor
VAANQAVTRLSRLQSRSPSLDEIAGEIDCTLEETLEALEAGHAYDAMSLDAPADRDGEARAFAETVGLRDRRYEVAEHRSDIASAIRVLPRREQEIVMLRFAGNLTESEIGERVGVSQMHVSRLLRRSLERLAVVAGDRSRRSAH